MVWGGLIRLRAYRKTRPIGRICLIFANLLLAYSQTYYLLIANYGDTF